jgi:hypothetical protein
VGGSARYVVPAQHHDFSERVVARNCSAIPRQHGCRGPCFRGGRPWFNDLQFALLRLALAGVVMAGAYFAILLYVMGEKAFYLNLLSGLKSSSRDNQSPELVTR